MNRTRACFLGLVLASTTSAAAADVVTLVSDRDNTLFEDAGGGISNGAGPVLFAGNNGQDLARRALLRFDVAGSLPLGARIDAVELRLNCSNAPNTTPRAVALHRVVRDWGEGASSTTSGSGAPAAPGDATWLHTFYSTSTWGVGGGDFAGTTSATLDVGDVGPYTWTSAGIKADVQEWLNGSAANFGWLMLGDETALNTARRFDSRENAVSTNRPTLTVHYSFNTTGLDEEQPVAPGTRLEACYPNPARSACRIGFVLASHAAARVVVVDVGGRQIATLVDDQLGAGRHEAVWSGRGPRGEALSSGIYLCRLVVDGRLIATRALARLR